MNYLGKALLNRKLIQEFIINRRKIKRVIFNRRIVWEKIPDIPQESIKVTPEIIYLNTANNFQDTVQVITNLGFEVNPL